MTKEAKRTGAPWKRTFDGFVVLGALALGSALATAAVAGSKDPIVLMDQGSFAFGGTEITLASGQLLHCDHGYTQYQVPKDAKSIPLIMWHSSSVRTWETTPDGRDGFQNIFLRKGWTVYTPDLPRLGRAAQGCVEMTYIPTFRSNGAPTPQTPISEKWDEQFARFRYPENPEVGEDPNVEGDPIETPAVVELVEKIGPAILLTHSGSGSRGFLTASKTRNVKGIISYEPIAFPFPENEPPGPIDSQLTGHIANITQPILIPPDEFQNLTHTKIQVVFGDLSLQGAVFQTVWQRAQQFAEELNSRGGDVELLYLPDVGVTGNGHFLMLELNNKRIADLASEWLKRKGLEGKGHSKDKDRDRDRDRDNKKNKKRR